MRRYLHGFWRHDKGVVAIEAAIVLPIMIFFIFASIEVYQYFRAVAILDRTAFSVADGLAMQPALYEGGPCDKSDHLCTYGILAEQLTQPLDFANGGQLEIRLFVAETYGSGSGNIRWNNTQGWSKRCNSAGNCSNLSALGAALQPVPAIPPPKTKDTVLMVKVTQAYQPFAISSRFWQSLGGSTQLSSVSFYRPRFDDLKYLN